MPDEGNLTRQPHRWDGSTYYGREQVKAAPFNNWYVGGYIFLAGLSGGAALLSTLFDLARGREARRIVRRARFLSLLGPTLGTIGLIADLRTPKRFYNMLRLFKPTSPMSIGSWILVAFGNFSAITAAAEFLGMRRIARAAQLPLAASGAGLGTYTASLLSATSTPLWAAAPCATAVRFASSSIASAASALSLRQGRSRIGRDLDEVALAALVAELAATLSAEESYRRTGVAPAPESIPGLIEQVGGTVLGTLAPIALLLASLAGPRRSPALCGLASLLVLAGSATMRISFMAAGDESARDPRISMRFARPENLGRVASWPVWQRK
jgi:formate-dependent nitrite reductase membrane component NrfD